MKAYVLRGINDLGLEDVRVPELMEGEALVKVKAAGICGSDIPRIFKTGAHVHPLIPGHEFSGQVIKCFSKEDEERLIGKPVGIFPLISCQKCGPCMHGKYEMCRNYNYLGSRRNGGFGEYVAVPVWNLLELPSNVSYEEAAMLEPMAVAVHAMRRVDINKGDNVVVCGLGTIGLLLTMFLKNLGVENIFVVGNKDFQCECVNQLGIDKERFCDSRSNDVNNWIMEKTNGNGVDVYFECVGKNDTVEMAVDVAAPSGKIVFVGNPYSDMGFDKNVYWKILRNQLEIRGTWNSSFTGEKDDDWHYALDKLASGKINPSMFISHRYSLNELYKGLEIMRDKSEDYVKIMGRFD